MGTVDIVTKEYMRENAIFADAFNYLIYNGKKVIDPAKLKEIDPTEIALPFGDEENRPDAGRRLCSRRDLCSAGKLLDGAFLFSVRPDTGRVSAKTCGQ